MDISESKLIEKCLAIYHFLIIYMKIGINKQRIIYRTPQQNGVTERYNKILLNTNKNYE